jgi:hypothetical protein
MKKRDIFLLLGAVAIIVVLWMAPPETTKPVPKDEIHTKFYDIVKTDGKKAAEKFCSDCHNADGVPFSENHPSKFRCLFCHKIRL